ncbi:hypothetical protein VNO80_12289 [Phaseolus coccineus]|uniref:Uncharacterized protein n=1 Tax=Phaseolus coccineus TaxID=3886 RepID=A0AAN9N4S9_PHACN
MAEKIHQSFGGEGNAMSEKKKIRREDEDDDDGDAYVSIVGCRMRATVLLNDSRGLEIKQLGESNSVHIWGDKPRSLKLGRNGSVRVSFSDLVERNLKKVHQSCDLDKNVSWPCAAMRPTWDMTCVWLFTMSGGDAKCTIIGIEILFRLKICDLNIEFHSPTRNGKWERKVSKAMLSYNMSNL